MTTNDEIFANVMRRFLRFPGHPADEPTILFRRGELLIDGRVDLTDEELDALRAFHEGSE